MHARVVTVQFRVGAIDDAVRVYRERVLQAARQQEGFRGLLVLIDPNTGKGMSVSLWEDAQRLAQSEAGDYLTQTLSELAPFTASPRFREVFRVELMALDATDVERPVGQDEATDSG